MIAEIEKIKTKNFFNDLPYLGAGLLYNPSLPDFLKENHQNCDYIEIIPDIFWTESKTQEGFHFEEIEAWLEILEWMKSKFPLVSHNLGISLGSAEYFETEYLKQLQKWNERYDFAWHSDHLSFVKVKGNNGHDHNAGLAVPVPYDKEVLDMIVERIKIVQQYVPKKFLIENNVYFIDIPDQDFTEPEFLNQLSAKSGCGLLLDLHNVYANSVNHKFSPFEFVESLDLERVIEIHIAGGSELGGMYTDSHAGPCPEPVWDLLEFTVAKTPNIKGVTFEFNESYFPFLKFDGINNHLERARKILNKNKL